MNKLSLDKRVQVIHCLVEGNSIRATVRMTGAAKNTVAKLLVEIGRACSEYQDKVFRNLECKRLECDEIWSFIGCKEQAKKQGAKGYGDVWTWTAIDSETKLVPSWYVGARDAYAGYCFMNDLCGRLKNRVQLTTDGHSAYLDAVERTFGADIDYAMLVKLYGSGPDIRQTEARYSPPRCTGTQKHIKSGNPSLEHVSTSYAERNNLTIRMSVRRFTRLTNAFSKKLQNHIAAISLHFMYYNFCRIHKTLRITPAMAAGVTDHVWEVADIVALLERQEALPVAA